MTKIAWDSEKQRNLEWRVALSCLAKAPNDTKIKRARHKSPIDYTDKQRTKKLLPHLYNHLWRINYV